MSVQIFTMRSFWDKKELKWKAAAKPVELITAKNHISLFQNIETIIQNNFADDERFNVFAPVSHSQGKSREFVSQDTLFFDIDKIDVEQKEKYPEIVARALGVDSTTCASIFTGAGIHFLIQMQTSFNDRDYFKRYKNIYLFWCRKIDEEMQKENLPGEADKDVFKPGVMIRLPFCEKRKPMDVAPEDQIIRNPVTAFNLNLEPLDFKFITDDSEKEPMPKKVSSFSTVRFGDVDAEAVFQGCSFLQHVYNNQEEIKEPVWYAALGIAAFLGDDNETAQKISEKHPKYERSQTELKCEQIKSSTSGPRLCSGISEIWTGCGACPHYKKIRTPLQIKSDAFIATKDQGFTTIGDKGKLNRHYDDLRKHLEQEYPYVTIGELDRVMIFNGTHYETVDKNWLRNFAEKNFLPRPEKETERAEFVNKVRANNYQPLDFLEPSHLEGLINCRNGVLDLKTKILMPHSKDYPFQYVLPYGFDATAVCPTWDKLLKLVTKDRQPIIDLLEEFLGFCLYGGDYEPNNFLILDGGGSNGKTTFLNCLKYVLGEKNYTAVSIAQLNANRYMAASLEGKLVSFAEEEPESVFKETGPLKKITGNSAIFVENKFEKGYRFVNRAKIIMSYNKVPFLGDTSMGMQRRMLVASFEENLKKNPHLKIPNVLESIRDELPGILNRGIMGWERLQRNGDFTNPQQGIDALQEMVHDSDSVQQWWDEYVQITHDDSKVLLLDAYEKYCSDMERGKRTGNLSYKGFCKRIRDLAEQSQVEVKKAYNGANMSRTIVGVKIVTEARGILPGEDY